jgi:hypothetical protein
MAAKMALNLSNYRETIAEMDLVHYVRSKCIPKPREKTVEINRKQQVVISRITMGYTRLTQGHKIEKKRSTICERCDTELTVDHIMKFCLKYQTERITSGLNICLQQQQLQPQHKQPLQQQQQQTQQQPKIRIPSKELREKILIFLESMGLIEVTL